MKLKSWKNQAFLIVLAIVALIMSMYHGLALWHSKDASYFLIDGDSIYILAGLHSGERWPPPLLWSPAIPLELLIGFLSLFPKFWFNSVLNEPYRLHVFKYLGNYIFYGRMIFLGFSYFIPWCGSYLILKRLGSFSAAFLFFIGLLSIRLFPDSWSGYQVDAETFSLFLFLFWLAFALKHRENPTKKTHYILFALAGIMTSQKFCNLPIAVFTYFYTRDFPFDKRETKKLNFKEACYDFMVTFITLAVCALPVMREFLHQLPQWLTIPFHSGPYNTGGTSLFDFAKLKEEISKLASLDIFIFSFFGCFVLLLSSFKKQSKWHIFNIFFLLFVVLIYLKLGVWRYLVVPISLILFLAALDLNDRSKALRRAVVGILVLILILMPIKELRQKERLLASIDSSLALEKFMKQNPPQGVRLITYIFAEDFGRIFANMHSGHYFPEPYYKKEFEWGFIFDNDEGKYNFVPDLENRGPQSTKDTCWSQVIVRDIYIEKLRKILAGMADEEKIPGSNNYVFTRTSPCEK
jgi:hypothetical protein